MIQVQIASTLDAAGVTGVRWVLIDPSEVPDPAAVAAPVQAARADAALPSPSLPGARVRRTSLTLHVVSAVLLLGALLGAWWVAGLMVESRGTANPQAVAAQARPAR